MIGNRKQEGTVCTILLHAIRKSPTPRENILTVILNRKKQSPTQDLNPACPDRMPSLYHLCHHYFLNNYLVILIITHYLSLLTFLLSDGFNF